MAIKSDDSCGPQLALAKLDVQVRFINAGNLETHGAVAGFFLSDKEEVCVWVQPCREESGRGICCCKGTTS